MAEHFRDDTYVRLAQGQVHVRCACGWASDPVLATWDDGQLVSDETIDELDDLYDAHIRPLSWPSPEQVLIRDEEGRDWLDGKPIYNGDPLELAMPGGVWIRGRYETRRRISGPVAMFYCRIGGPAADNGVTDHVPQVSFTLPPRAVLRRPEGRR